MVWHSISQLYWPAAEIADVDAILTDYGKRHLLARVTMEFGGGGEIKPEVRTTVWQPGQQPRHHRLGSAHHHGPPVRLEFG